MIAWAVGVSSYLAVVTYISYQAYLESISSILSGPLPYWISSSLTPSSSGSFGPDAMISQCRWQMSYGSFESNKEDHIEGKD